MRYFHEGVSSLKNCENGRFIANVGKNEYALVDRIGRISDITYYELEARQDGYFSAKKGFFNETLIDLNGNVVCEEAKEIDLFSDDGIALVTELDGSKRWLTKQGVKFGEQFKDIGCFSGGLGCVMRDDGKWTYVNKQLEMADVAFDRVHPFLYGENTFVEIDGENYVINKQFQILSGPYQNIMWIEDNGLILTRNKDAQSGKVSYVYYSPDGKQISKPYDMVHGFVNGLCRVHEEKGHNFIDESGHEISKEYFKMAGNFGKNFAYVGGFDEKGDFTFTYIRRDGSLFDSWYPAIGEESEGLISAMKGTKYFVMNDKEKVVSRGYRRISGFYDGHAYIESSKNKYTYINHNFEPFDEEFDSVHVFSEGFGIVKKDGVVDAINSHQIKLSELSALAQQIEQNPILVLNIPNKIMQDEESAYLLCSHAIEVLNFALSCSKYDDVQKAQFAKDKEMIEVLKLKLQSRQPKIQASVFGE